jgi:hypothetical protein
MDFDPKILHGKTMLKTILQLLAGQDILIGLSQDKTYPLWQARLLLMARRMTTVTTKIQINIYFI